MIQWEDGLVVKIRKLIITGGELKVIVEKRGQERIISSFEYPENKTRYESVVIPFED